MEKSLSEREEKQPAGQSLSVFFDAVMSDFTYILWTRAVLSLNTLEAACGGRRRGAVFGYPCIILHSRHARNQLVNRS